MVMPRILDGRLQNKTAIVTGAGRGIGRAIATVFAKEGANLVVVSRTESELAETAREIHTIGAEVIQVVGDVSNEYDVKKIVNAALGEFNSIDVLVNNAGILGPIGPLFTTNVELWTKTIQTNLVGVYLCCRHVLPHMVKKRAGKIINLSGGGATSPYPRFSAYATSKAGVVGLTQTLAEEVKEYNIQVNAIAPGLVNTRLQDEILAAGDLSGDRALLKAREAKEKGAVPPTKAAELAVFLASEDSGGLTGRVISAVWDDWQRLKDRRELEAVMKSEFYTLRRIDGILFNAIRKEGKH